MGRGAGGGGAELPSYVYWRRRPTVPGGTPPRMSAGVSHDRNTGHLLSAAASPGGSRCGWSPPRPLRSRTAGTVRPLPGNGAHRSRQPSRRIRYPTATVKHIHHAPAAFNQSEAPVSGRLATSPAQAPTSVVAGTGV